MPFVCSGELLMDVITAEEEFSINAKYFCSYVVFAVVFVDFFFFLM